MVAGKRYHSKEESLYIVTNIWVASSMMSYFNRSNLNRDGETVFTRSKGFNVLAGQKVSIGLRAHIRYSDIIRP